VAGLLGGGASAPPAGQPPRPGEKRPKQVDWTANYVENHKNAAGEGGWGLTDDGEVTHVDFKDPRKKMVLTADRVEATEQKDGSTVAVATGHPKARDDRSDVVGDKITMYLKNRRAVVEGNVKIVTRPKKGADGSPESTGAVSSAEAP